MAKPAGLYLVHRNCAQEHSFQYPMNFREALEGSVDSAVDAPLPSYMYNCDRVERTTTHTNVYKSNLCANRSSSQLYIEVSCLYIHCSNILTLLVRIVGLINLAASHKFQYTAKIVQLKGNWSSTLADGHFAGQRWKWQFLYMGGCLFTQSHPDHMIGL